MDAFKIVIKLFAAKDDFASDQFVPIFHRWIQRQDFPGHLLIDVADYAHVKTGPGTVLICHEANLHMDRGENRLGIMYVRKTAAPGNFQDRLLDALKSAFQAASRMEAEEGLAGKLKFRTDEIVVRINDRLLAPSTQETFAAIKNDINAVAGKLFKGKPFTIEEHISSLTLFEVRLKCPEAPAIGAIAL
jgi:hypothetical protein